MFDDPVLAAVAPRVRPDRRRASGRPSALARFSDRHSALDLGPAEGEVGPDACRPLRADGGAGGAAMLPRLADSIDGPAGRRGRRPGVAAARRGLAGPLRALGHRLPPGAGLVERRCSPDGSATAPRRRPSPDGTPAGWHRSSSAPGRPRRRSPSSPAGRASLRSSSPVRRSRWPARSDHSGSLPRAPCGGALKERAGR